MNQEKLKAVQAAIVKAVPEIMETHRKAKHIYDNDHLDSERIVFENVKKPRTIRLADVLLGMQKSDSKEKQVWMVGLWGDFRRVQRRINGSIQITNFAQWNLRNDDLTAQSPECIDFLYDLLAV